ERRQDAGREALLDKEPAVATPVERVDAGSLGVEPGLVSLLREHRANRHGHAMTDLELAGEMFCLGVTDAAGIDLAEVRDELADALRRWIGFARQEAFDGHFQIN